MGAPNQGNKVTISKKTLYSIIAIILIAIVGVALFLYWKQSTTDAVVITNFNKNTSGTMPIYPMINWEFTVVVKNRGSNDVSGLTAYVRLLGNGQELGQDSNQMRTLQAGHQVTWI